MKQLLEIVHSLGVKVEQLEGDAHRVAGVELAQVADMYLGSEAGMTAVFHVVGAAADQLEGLVDRAVEQHIVVGHVEMAIIVNPAGLDPRGSGTGSSPLRRWVSSTATPPPGLPMGPRTRWCFHRRQRTCRRSSASAPRSAYR